MSHYLIAGHIIIVCLASSYMDDRLRMTSAHTLYSDHNDDTRLHHANTYNIPMMNCWRASVSSWYVFVEHYVRSFILMCATFSRFEE